MWYGVSAASAVDDLLSNSVSILRVLRVLAVVALVLALQGPSAGAAVDQEASFQDNALAMNPATLGPTLKTLRSLGVDRLVVSVNWYKLAPASSSRRRPPGFDGTDPADYPASNWAYYDRIVEQAKVAGLSVNFTVMGGAPLWAVGRAPAPSMRSVWYPSAREFGAFVHALGERYSGHYTPPGASGPLPRVSYWSIWNEPNVGSSSLSPQVVNGVEVAPALYRALLDAAWSALLSTGHGPNTDTILVGQTASTGHLDPGLELGMQPLRFIRALYCLSSSYRPLRGAAAQQRRCPTTAAGSEGFPAQHPALFRATGWAHHPYYLGDTAPTTPAPAIGPDWVTFANLPKLEGALDGIQRVYGSSRRLPIYLTEYGIETNPPRADVGISPTLQATYLNEAEYIAWRDPRVRTLSQYLLQDAAPLGHATVSSFATGLIYTDGSRKPSYAAYRLPIWLPATGGHRGQALEVWGCVRPAKRYAGRTVPPVQIQLDGRTVSSVPISNREGYFDVRVGFPHGGTVRLAWPTPGGPTIYSRDVSVTEDSAATASPLAPIGVAAVLVLLVGGYVIVRRVPRARPETDR
jgi:hypothetical protein